VKILLLNQAFPPDVVSSAQHAGDLVKRLKAASHDVTVIAGRRAYDTPSVTFPAEADWHGVTVLRVRGTGFGKTARWRRALDFATLLLSYAVRVVRLGRFDVVIAMTSPPLISFMAALYVRAFGGRLVLWVMDLNPDEAIAAGWLKQGSLVARVLGWCLNLGLRTATRIVVLDRFMSDLVIAKLSPARRDEPQASTVAVLPPWSHDSAVWYDQQGRGEFRRAHGLDGKFVVMYSGNHSPCHPLRTLLDAARHLRDRNDVVFCFVGGGSEFETVKRYATEHALSNIVCIPYQPIERLSASLSAADLHAVVMGNEFVGMIHPCKVYNVLRLGIPLLYIGPDRSHIADLLPATSVWAGRARHGDVESAVTHIVEAAAAAGSRYDESMRIAERFRQDTLETAFLHLIEGTESRPCVSPSPALGEQ
jgi:colanic acid biosynthesis glycosyl transferase WcaI